VGNGTPQWRWTAKATISRSGPEDLDGQPYNKSSGSYTEVVGIAGSFLREVLEGAGVSTEGATYSPKTSGTTETTVK
jgi:hypothetical protein